jgi:hypothetical protein
MAKKEFKYEIVENLAVLQESSKSDWVIELNKISWNDNPPTLDLRRINRGVDAKIVLGKGVSFNDEGANILVDALLEAGFGSEKVIKRILKERGYKIGKKSS